MTAFSGTVPASKLTPSIYGLDHTNWICKLAEDFLSQDCIRWSPPKTGTSILICHRSNVP
jgi:hypothetical protein